MILMTSPGVFWLSAQQAPPRRKNCALTSYPLPGWPPSASCQTPLLTRGRLAPLGTDGQQRGADRLADRWHGARGWGWRAGSVTLISRSRHWMVLDHRTQIVNEQSALSTKESLVKCLSASNFCFANRLALRNRPKNITRHAAQKTMSSLSLIFNSLIRNKDGDSSVVRASDSWLKGPGFKSLQERRENFLLQGQLSVLTLISVCVPPPCYRSST